jgi:hypothetical protein
MKKIEIEQRQYLREIAPDVHESKVYVRVDDVRYYAIIASHGRMSPGQFIIRRQIREGKVELVRA